MILHKWRALKKEVEKIDLLNSLEVKSVVIKYKHGELDIKVDCHFASSLMWYNSVNLVKDHQIKQFREIYCRFGDKMQTKFYFGIGYTYI